MDNCKQELPYIINGKQLDNNIFDKKGQKIIWRTDKSQAEIEIIMQDIQDRIYNIASNFHISLKEVELYSLPLINHNKNMQESIKKQSLHSCNYDFTKSTPKTQQESRAQYNLKSKHSRFLTKHFIINANKKLNKAKVRHLLFCKNSPLAVANNPTIKVNANIFLCQNKDWIAEYKESVQPILCGRFYIRPSWHEANDLYENLIIDPSFSFGSGHHATTAMCILMLEGMDLNKKTMLDVGCGSGILSLVAAKLGAFVYACDTDMQACNQSIKNFQTNSLTYNHIWQGSMQSIGQLDIPCEYDYICANIVSSVILLLKKELILRLKQGGILILSGILQEHETKILDSFKSLSLMEKKQIDEWLCFKFIKK